MNPDAIGDETPGQATTRGDPVSGSGVLEDAQSLWHELSELTHDRFRLAALETQRAGKSLVDMIVAGVMVGVFLIGAWLGLMAAAMLELVEHDVVATSSAILLAVASNLLLALILFGVIRRKSRYLQFPATLRSLQSMPSGRLDTEKS
ncbi:phage holin family protein [Methylobacter svalbardensis]|uniref:phage holin family protein n=1 Tax=Methylobacter svalbardensis TaxID=3080016 RepID=UPI0030EDD1F8